MTVVTGRLRPGRQRQQHRPACRSLIQNLSWQAASLAQQRNVNKTFERHYLQLRTRYQPPKPQRRSLALSVKAYPPRHNVCREETSFR